MAALHQHARFTAYIDDLLKLIKHRVLLIDSQARARSHELLAEMEGFHEKALLKPTYLMEWSPENHEAEPLAQPTVEGQFDDRISNILLKDEHHKSRISARFFGSSRIFRQSIRAREPRPRDDAERKNQPNHHNELMPGRSEITSPNELPSVRLDAIEDTKDMESKMYTDLYQSVEETVQYASGVTRNSGSQVATIRVFWQLQQCIQDELDGTPDLGEILTISGNAGHSWAAKCEEYVEATWGNLGRQLLSDLELYLRNISVPTG
jgi:hypothetical protein